MKRLLAVALVAAMLGACAGAPEPVPEALADVEPELDFHLLLGEIALQRSRMAEAAGHYAAAARLSDNAEIAQRATAIAYQAGLDGVALESAQRWHQLQPDSESAHRYLGVLYLRAGEVERSAAHFTRVIEEADEREEALDELLALLGSQDRRRSAVAVMAEIVEAYPDEPVAQYAMARLSLMAAQPAPALAAARRLQALEPGNRRGQLTLAQALLADGQREEAVELARSLVDETDDADLALEVSGLLIAAGEHDEARRRLDGLLSRRPGDEGVLRALALLELRSGELDAARAHFNTLRQGRRYRDESYYYLGRIDEDQGRSMQAVRNLSRVTSGTQAVEAQVRVARLYRDMGDVDSALRHLEDFGVASPRHADAMLAARAQLLVDEGRDAEALALFDEPLAARPDDEGLLDTRAGVYAAIARREAEAGDQRSALRWYRDGLREHRDNTQLLYQRALLYERMDRVRDALRELERLVRMDPESPVFLNALGYTLADRTTEYQRAYELIERALEREPDSAPIIDSMGWVLYRLGDLDGALEYLLQAWALMRDPEVAAHLVEVHHARGEHEQALELLEEAWSRWPGDRHLRPWREQLLD